MGEETKKSRYTEAQHKATNKYRQERAQIVVLMTKTQREEIQRRAQDSGLSVNQYILSKVL